MIAVRPIGSVRERIVAIERLRDWTPTPPRILVLSVVLCFLAVDARLCVAVLGAQPLAVDWSPLWAAAWLPVAGCSCAADLRSCSAIDRTEASMSTSV